MTESRPNEKTGEIAEASACADVLPRCWVNRASLADITIKGTIQITKTFTFQQSKIFIQRNHILL